VSDSGRHGSHRRRRAPGTPEDPGPTQLGSVIREALAATGASEEAVVWTAVFANWALIVGTRNAEHVRPHAVRDGRLGGAILDVFETEPLPQESPLWSMSNVLMTPHTGGWTPEYTNRLIGVFLANVQAYRELRPLPTAVDLTRGY